MLVNLIDNINKVNDIISECESHSAYDNGRVTLVGASKTMKQDIVDYIDRQQLLAVLGENHAQELRDKYREGQSFQWHYIGNLQSSNLRIVLPRVSLIHSLDRISICADINKYCASHNIEANCLIQLNLGREETKSGFLSEELADAIETVYREYGHIKLRGIMSVAPIAGEDVLTRLYSQLGELYQLYRQRYPDFQCLSAGMTNDYQLAIRYAGSNMVRIGRAIFGDRDYK